MSEKKFKLALIAVVVLQIAIIGGMLSDRILTIRNGQEVILQSRFVDPRDLFRGHYVTLNLVAGTIGKNLPGGSETYSYGETVFVSLKEGENGFWTANAVSKTLPEYEISPVLAGEFRGTRGNTLNIWFPFDRYFAPKKRAQELEEIRNQQRLGVVIAVNSKGGGVIKGISIDGKTIYDEPLL